VETESGAFIVSMLAASDALTYTTRRTVEQAEATGIGIIDVPELAAERSAGFITRRGQAKSPTLAALFEALSALAAADPRN
jgi:DNA-binding transcriptional LysR family regulator